MRWTRIGKAVTKSALKLIQGITTRRRCGRTLTAQRGHGRIVRRRGGKHKITPETMRTFRLPCPGKIVGTPIRSGWRQRLIDRYELRCNFCGRTV